MIADAPNAFPGNAVPDRPDRSRARPGARCADWLLGQLDREGAALDPAARGRSGARRLALFTQVAAPERAFFDKTCKA